MSKQLKKLIAVEEHYMSENVNRTYKVLLEKRNPDQAQRAKAAFVDAFVAKGLITEIGKKRLDNMDKTGVDVQLISYGNNSPMYLEKEEAVPLCRQANDNLATCCRIAPERFYGCAVLPVADVETSVAELERCVKELRFKAVVFNGGIHGKFLDDPEFYPIFEKAAELGVPVQFHPGEVDASVSAHYYQGPWPLSVTNVFAGHGIGWHYDSGLQYIRFILAGVFDRLPNLTMLCGHWGELLPYYFNRMDTTLTPEVTGLKHNISYYFKNNMFITPSGMYFEDDLEFCLKKVGAERIMWATDYPYRLNENAKEFLSNLNLEKADIEKIAHENAEKLFGI